MFEFDFEGLEEFWDLPKKSLSITVNALDGTEYKVLKSSGCTIREIKASLEEEHGIPVYEQRLCCDSQELHDETFLYSDCRDLQLLRIAANVEEWLERVRENPFALSEAPLPIRANEDIIRAAAAREVSALAYAAGAVRVDEDFALGLVSRNGLALKYFSPELQSKRNIVLAAVQSAGSVLQHAEASLKADPEIVLAAVRQEAKALMHADPNLLYDTDFTMQAMATNRLVGDYLLSLTLDGDRRSEELRAAEEAWNQGEQDARDSALPLETAHSYFQRGAQRPSCSKPSEC